MRKLLLLCALAALAGCTTPAVYKDPVSGKVDQCFAHSHGLFGFIGRSEIAECSEAYERMGWKKQ